MPLPFGFAFSLGLGLGLVFGLVLGLGLDEVKISFAALPFPIRVFFSLPAMLACSRFLPLGLCFCLFYSCSL